MTPLDRFYAENGIGHDREERDHGGQHHLRGHPEAEPDNEQRNQRNLGHDLKPDDERVECAFQPRHLAERRTQSETDDDGDEEACQRLEQGDPDMPVGARIRQQPDRGVPYIQRRRQDERRDVEEADIGVPGEHEHDQQQRRCEPGRMAGSVFRRRNRAAGATRVRASGIPAWTGRRCRAGALCRCRPAYPSGRGAGKAAGRGRPGRPPRGSNG